MSTQYKIIPMFELTHWWPRLELWIDKALEHNPLNVSKDSILRFASNGLIHIWIGLNEEDEITALGIGQFEDHADYRALRVVHASGKELQDVIDGMDYITDFAKQCGAAFVLVDGRRGWLRTLKEKGFHEVYTTIGKEL